MKSRGDEMKKSVIITIIVIYVLAIVVVGFIGLKMKVYDEQKYVEKIECISDGYKDYDPNTENLGYDCGIFIKDLESGEVVETGYAFLEFGSIDSLLDELPEITE